MIFHEVNLTEDGRLTASAEGHPTDVVRAFRDLAMLILGSRGPWRITDVVGTCSYASHLDSSMKWNLRAALKDIS